MLKSCASIPASHSFPTETIPECKPSVDFLVCLGFCGCFFSCCILNMDCSDCIMLVLNGYTHLCKPPLHFLPVLGLTADSGIKRGILGLEQRNRSTPLLEKDTPFRKRLEYFRQAQKNQKAIANILN